MARRCRGGLKMSLNVTDITGETGTLEVVVGQPSGAYNSYPITHTMAFVTLQANF